MAKKKKAAKTKKKTTKKLAKKKAKAKIKTSKEIACGLIPEGAEFAEQDGVYYVKCAVPDGGKRKVWQLPIRTISGIQDAKAKAFAQKKLSEQG